MDILKAQKQPQFENRKQLTENNQPPVILFISDMHFGRSDLATEKMHEAALIACLKHFESQVDHLFLVGDVFDQYIEYPNLVPKGFVRFQSLLADWTDAGRPVTYLIGNHDPWHIDYFQQELGVNVAYDALTEPLYGRNVYLNHGDIVASRFPLNRFIKRALQHPVPVTLYRLLLPADMGFRLARWVNQRIHTDVINDEVVIQLRTHATAVIKRDQIDLAVMGHSHNAELTSMDGGVYVNTGCWRLHRTFATMEADRVTLCEWNDRDLRPIPIKETRFTRQAETSVRSGGLANR